MKIIFTLRSLPLCFDLLMMLNSISLTGGLKRRSFMSDPLPVSVALILVSIEKELSVYEEGFMTKRLKVL